MLPTIHAQLMLLPGGRGAYLWLGTEPSMGSLAVAKRCIVIGAGNTAIDMATQMARLGAAEVTLVYRRGVEAMSATDHEQEIAKANGVTTTPIDIYTGMGGVTVGRHEQPASCLRFLCLF